MQDLMEELTAAWINRKQNPAKKPYYKNQHSATYPVADCRNDLSDPQAVAPSRVL